MHNFSKRILPFLIIPFLLISAHKQNPHTSANIDLSYMNVLYVGIDNPVNISVPGYPPNNVIMSISGGSVKKLGGGRYKVRVKPYSRNATIAVSVLEGEKAKMIVRKTFRIKKLPRPSAWVGGLRSDGRPKVKGALLAQRGLIAVLQQFPYENLKFRIQSFKASFYHKDSLYEHHNEGYIFSDEVRKRMSALKKGDIATFTDIKCKLFTLSDTSDIEVIPTFVTIK